MRKLLLILFIVAFTLSTICAAADVYITQNASGGNTGADCADAHSAAWFNSNATGGNTYHLCGTFTGTPGQTMLTVPSGAAGNILTVLFEPGTVMTAPYWGGTYAGAISILGTSYIKIDGGSDGVIENTANGDALMYQHASRGIYVQENSSNIEIANITIQHIYDSVGGGTGNANATNTSNIFIGPNTGTLTNISVHDSTLNNAGQGVEVAWDGSIVNNINIYNNFISDHRFQVIFGSYMTSGSTSNINVYGNEMTGWSNWFTTNDYYHLDGIIAWGHHGYPINLNIYNNYIHGTWGTNATSFVYCTCDGGSGTGSSSVCNIFNNLFVIDKLVSAGAGRENWTGFDAHNGPHKIINNTFVAQSTYNQSLVNVVGPVSQFTNNIYLNSTQALSMDTTPASSIASSDYNLYYGMSGNPFSNNSGTYWTYAQWQGFGYDAHGQTANPNLDGNYKPQASSKSVIGQGTNLTSLCTGDLTALCADKSGSARPASGLWDLGAYQYSTKGAIAPPKGLVAIVH